MSTRDQQSRRCCDAASEHIAVLAGLETAKNVPVFDDKIVVIEAPDVHGEATRVDAGHPPKNPDEITIRRHANRLDVKGGRGAEPGEVVDHSRWPDPLCPRVVVREALREAHGALDEAAFVVEEPVEFGEGSLAAGDRVVGVWHQP